MIPDAVRHRFETLARSGDADPAPLARAAKQGDTAAALDLAALFARVGFIEPALIRDCYDAAADGWFGDASPPLRLTAGEGDASPALWGPRKIYHPGADVA